MPSIAAALGEVGLPAPVSELAARTWDAVIVGGGHNGLACAAYLARAGQSVLVLERRERLGGACTLERPFPDPRYVVSPCAYVIGLLDRVVIEELDLRRHGLEVFVADPNLWAPFEDGTSLAQWNDDAATQASLDALGLSPADVAGYWAYEQVFDEMRQLLRTRGRDSWIGESPTRDELEEMLGHDQWMIDILFEASIADVLDHYVADQRLKDALYGQGVIGAYAGPRDWGTASVKLMHYQGDLEDQGPVWGYVKGGMGMVSFALAEAAVEAGAALACGVEVAEVRPGEGVVLDGGERVLARAVICNADPKRALDDARGLGRGAGRVPVAPRGVADPQPGREVQRRALPAADLPRRGRRVVAVPVDDLGDPGAGRRAAGLRGLPGRPGQRGLRRGLLPDRVRPVTRARGPAPHERLRPVRAVRRWPAAPGTSSATPSGSSSST